MQIYRMGVRTGRIYDDETQEMANEPTKFIKADSLEEAEQKANTEISAVVSPADARLQEALSWIIWYNGHDDDILKVREHIQSYPGLGYVLYPNFLPEDCDIFIRIFWSLLVLMYGSYGTSPRYGWIEERKGALEFIDQVRNTYKED